MYCALEQLEYMDYFGKPHLQTVHTDVNWDQSTSIALQLDIAPTGCFSWECRAQWSVLVVCRSSCA